MTILTTSDYCPLETGGELHFHASESPPLSAHVVMLRQLIELMQHTNMDRSPIGETLRGRAKNQQSERKYNFLEPQEKFMSSLLEPLRISTYLHTHATHISLRFSPTSLQHTLAQASLGPAHPNAQPGSEPGG